MKGMNKASELQLWATEFLLKNPSPIKVKNEFMKFVREKEDKKGKQLNLKK